MVQFLKIGEVGKFLVYEPLTGENLFVRSVGLLEVYSYRTIVVFRLNILYFDLLLKDRT